MNIQVKKHYAQETEVIKVLFADVSVDKEVRADDIDFSIWIRQLVLLKN